MGVKDLLFEESESGHDLPFFEKATLIIIFTPILWLVCLKYTYCGEFWINLL